VDVELVTRVVIVGAAALLAGALLVFGPSSAPRPHRVRGARGRNRRHMRLDATNLMSYVAASMAVTLGGALAIMR
jgi:hypothetical protein